MKRSLAMLVGVVVSGAAGFGFAPSRAFVSRSVTVQRSVALPVMELKQLQEEVQLLRSELVRKDAIIKSLLSTIESTSITTDTDSSGTTSSTPLQDLCQISKEACDAVTPMLVCLAASNPGTSRLEPRIHCLEPRTIGCATHASAPCIEQRAFYEKISDQRHGGSSKLKSDATYFTIADGIVQHMFINHLFAGNKFAQIVGEEDESVINILEKPYMVDDLVVPDEFNAIIATTLKEIDQIGTRIDSNLYKAMTVFVDPIDGTREFATAQARPCPALHPSPWSLRLASWPALPPHSPHTPLTVLHPLPSVHPPPYQGEYVTVLIGYNDAVGQPAAGIVYRPLTEPVTRPLPPPPPPAHRTPCQPT